MSDSTPGPSHVPLRSFCADALAVQVHADAKAAGNAAADRVAAALQQAVAESGAARVVFAAAPSQTHVLAALKDRDVPWSRVEAFHMDEYVGLSTAHPAGFGQWLSRHLFAAVPLRAVHLLRPDADPEAECARYAALLAEAPVDAVVAGIGENGHLAFNDPPFADFADPRQVKLVDLDLASRQQQVNDQQFPDLDAVPQRALTLTVPALMRARTLTCVVSGARKRQAVGTALTGPIAESCPASVLRRHPDAVLYLDPDAAPEESW